MAEPTRIKICGVREPEHGALAATLGVWAIGLMFAPASPRVIDRDAARAVADATDPAVARVGVFVGAEPGEIARTARAVGLTHIQVHGPADIGAIREATGLPVLAGFGIADEHDLATAVASSADLVLLDAQVAGADGGTGRSFDWGIVAAKRPQRPFLLAGGLRPDNVAAAIAAVAPWGVDVSSGVEGRRGVKDSRLIAEFVAAVRGADQHDDRSGG
jgi:phosphoribosylanthranilate isomerase